MQGSPLRRSLSKKFLDCSGPAGRAPSYMGQQLFKLESINCCFHPCTGSGWSCPVQGVQALWALHSTRLESSNAFTPASTESSLGFFAHRLFLCCQLPSALSWTMLSEIEKCGTKFSIFYFCIIGVQVHNAPGEDITHGCTESNCCTRFSCALPFGTSWRIFWFYFSSSKHWAACFSKCLGYACICSIASIAGMSTPLSRSRPPIFSQREACHFSNIYIYIAGILWQVAGSMWGCLKMRLSFFHSSSDLFGTQKTILILLHIHVGSGW